MSDSIEVTSCLQHRENGRYFVVYEDLQEISEEHPDKVAAFLRILEVKTNKKIIAYSVMMEEAINARRPLPPLKLWVEIPYSEFVHWSLNTVSRSSFQIADKEATKKLLVKSRVLSRPVRPDDPESPKVSYKEYLLVLENVQAAINKKELPITGGAYEEYGNVPPVIENIPLLKKTWGMLQETREGMLQKTRPPVEKNRFLNKEKDKSLKEKQKKERTLVPSTQSSSSLSLSTQEEEKRDGLLKWLNETNVTVNDTPAAKGYVAELRQHINSRDKLHKLYVMAQEWNQNKKDKTVYLGNLANKKLLAAFLQAEQAMQSILPTAESIPTGIASESQIEALAAEIQTAYPELVLRLSEDTYGPYVDVLYGDESQECYTVRDAEDWSRLCSSQKRLERVRVYGSQCCLVTQ